MIIIIKLQRTVNGKIQRTKFHQFSMQSNTLIAKIKLFKEYLRKMEPKTPVEIDTILLVNTIEIINCFKRINGIGSMVNL